MSPLDVLLILVAIIALISGAIILTPFGIIILAFGIYSWKELYPMLLRIGLWSTQRQNFVPSLALSVVVVIFIFIIGIATWGLFGFSGTAILLFIWLFFTWLLVIGIAGFPIALAVTIWAVRGIRWLWFRYRKFFWSAIPWDSSKADGGTIVIRKSEPGSRGNSAEH